MLLLCFLAFGGCAFLCLLRLCSCAILCLLRTFDPGRFLTFFAAPGAAVRFLVFAFVAFSFSSALACWSLRFLLPLLPLLLLLLLRVLLLVFALVASASCVRDPPLCSPLWLSGLPSPAAAPALLAFPPLRAAVSSFATALHGCF